MAERKIEVWYFLIDREKRTALREASFVESSPDATVAGMKKQIKQEESVTLMHVDASMLIVWRCTDPNIDFDNVDIDNVNERLERVFSSEGKAERLKPEQQVGKFTNGKLLIEVPVASRFFLFST